MKRYLIFLFALLIFMGCNRTQNITPMVINTDREWAFRTGDSIFWADPSFDDTGWKKILISENWENQGYPDYDGYGWYRQSVEIPVSFEKPIRENGGLIISYSNADDADEFYFNGRLVGSTGGLPPAYVSKYGVSRRYIVPGDWVKAGQKNQMAIRVYDGGGGGGVVSEEISIHPMSEVYKLPLATQIQDEDWIFEGEPSAAIGISILNETGKTVRTDVSLTVTTDDYQPVGETIKKVTLGKNDSSTIIFNLSFPTPGFYRCTACAIKDGVKGEGLKFNIGYEPEKIVSPVDAHPDFEEFWKITRAGLDQVAPDYRLELLKDKSTGARNLYHVKMQSFGNVTIEGYYAVPKAPGKYPVIVGYMGYGSDPWMPGSESNPGFAEFVLSVRGQGIQMAGNTYGKWIVHGLDSKENYYYRGAFMDLVRAIDFVASRPEVDAGKIVAEGGSQGGAFTLAACALDPRIKAAAPAIPFLSDYPDYFRIAPWPASDFKQYLKENPARTWDEVYSILSYFDVKNLAPRIKCPILMAAGLQDDVCPPHTNFASYNQITAEKKYFVFPDQGHSVPDDWYRIRMDFFKEKLGIK